MASGVASDLLRIDPKNAVATRYLRSKRNISSVQGAAPSSPVIRDETFGRSLDTPADRLAAEKNLENGYTSLRAGARILFEEMQAVQSVLAGKDDGSISNLQAI